MTVNVKLVNGIRHGTFDIHGISGNFPTQSITTTNRNHAAFLHVPNFDFGTKFLEIIEKYPRDILNDPIYRDRRVKDISKIIQKNPLMLCLLILRGSKNTIKMTKEENLIFIKFQLDCGFKLIKAFFKHNRYALENSRDYRHLIPKDRTLVIVIDENLEHGVFKKLYEDAYDRGDEIIGFLGREPSKTNSENQHNFEYISNSESDNVIRLVSFIRRSFGQVVSSLVYHWYGLDVYSFSTRFGPTMKITNELRALNKFTYRPLEIGTSLVCVITGMNLFNSARRFEKQKKSHVPVSIHDILRLNEEFRLLPSKYTRTQIEQIVHDVIF